MTWIMTVMFVFFSLQVPAGLSLYWVVGNALALAQQIYVNRQAQHWDAAATLKPALATSGSAAAANAIVPTKSETRAEAGDKTTSAEGAASPAGARRKRRRRR